MRQDKATWGLALIQDGRYANSHWLLYDAVRFADGLLLRLYLATSTEVPRASRTRVEFPLGNLVQHACKFS